MDQTYDFEGWVTKNDIRCSDGRTIRANAFAHDDGTVVPLVWNHGHDSITNVLGKVLLKNKPEGVYGYGSFNDGENGQLAKTLIQHGDIASLSICANKLKATKSGDILHGDIKEVSLVLAGANEGAKIENVLMHSDESQNEIEFYISEEDCVLHTDGSETVEDINDDSEDGKTIQDIIDTMSEEQKEAMYAVIGQIVKDYGIDEADNEESDEEDTSDEEEDTSDDSEEVEEDKKLKHSEEYDYMAKTKRNIFDTDPTDNQVHMLTHADGMEIIGLAKESGIGTLKSAMKTFEDENGLEHADVVGGFVQSGDGNVTALFPEYKDLNPGAPELITNDQEWINAVLAKVHKSPISRVRTRQVDIRNIDTLRAKGYPKGAKKAVTGNFKLVRRTTDPQTIYVRNNLHRDDIVDIVDFDYVQYLYGIDKMALNEELAMAIMLGDGREDEDPDKIMPEHIRPIWGDDELYTLHVDIDFEAAKNELQGTNTGGNFGENFIKAEALITTVLHAREKYRGSGTPDLYCTPHMVNTMLLARDLNGRRIYSTVAELASALNVGKIYTAEQFEGKTRTTSDSKKKQLVCLITNLSDYSLGATKGGEVTHFTQFDIDFNQEKSLLETRCSGALTRVYSAIAIEEDVTSGGHVG